MKFPRQAAGIDPGGFNPGSIRKFFRRSLFEKKSFDLVYDKIVILYIFITNLYKIFKKTTIMSFIF